MNKNSEQVFFFSVSLLYLSYQWYQSQIIKIKRGSVFQWNTKIAQMASENFVQLIPCFDGHYGHWSLFMENFLSSKKYWNVVESGAVTPIDGEAITDSKQKEVDRLKLKYFKAKNYLFQAINRFILETIIQQKKRKTSQDI